MSKASVKYVSFTHFNVITFVIGGFFFIKTLKMLSIF